MSNLKLTDAQLVLLSAASQRDDHLITVPDTLKVSAAKAAISKLRALGLVQELGVGLGEPACRRDDLDQPIGLKLTSAGLAAIGLDGEPEHQVSEDPAADDSGDPNQQASAARSPRDGSKQALVIDLLSREEGASLDDLVQATGWLPHTTRAALTGLRQRGYPVRRTKTDQGHSMYRLAPIVESSTADAPLVEA